VSYGERKRAGRGSNERRRVREARRETEGRSLAHHCHLIRLYGALGLGQERLLSLLLVLLVMVVMVLLLLLLLVKVEAAFRRARQVRP